MGISFKTTPVAASGITIDPNGVDYINGNGDVNGDGISDILITYLTSSSNGLVSVIYGQSTGFSNNVIFDGTDNTKGFQIYIGTGSAHYIGNYAPALADINGDSISDMLVYVETYKGNGAATLAIYGQKGNSNNIDLNNISPVMITSGGNGPAPYNIGDINGDGITDVAMHLSTAFTVLYGNKNGWGNMDINTITPAEGFTVSFGYYYGTTAQIAGQVLCGVDINGDGKKDVVFGNPYAVDPAVSNTGGGIIFVIYGGNNLNNMNLSTAGSLTPSIGFRILAPQNTYCGNTVSDMGDVNGDGVSDLGFTCNAGTNWPGLQGPYIIYGHKGTFNDIDLTTMPPSEGYSYINAQTNAYGCNFISNIGDINSDGTKDLAVSCTGNSPLGRYQAGEVFVLYGDTNVTGNNGSNVGNNSNVGNITSDGTHSYDISLLSTALLVGAAYELMQGI